MQEIASQIAAIRADTEHGATFLTQEALTVLKDAAAVIPGDTSWEDSLTWVGKTLIEAKSPMAGLANATDRFLQKLLKLGPLEGKTQAAALLKELLTEFSQAADVAASRAAELLPERGEIVTCNYSSTVVRVFEKALAAGKSLRATVFEPLPGSDDPGRRLADELRQLGISATATDSLAVERTLGSVHGALIGADAVTPAFVINGVPSLAMARAVQGRVPLYVVTETLKFSRVARAAPGYDLVPVELATAVVTQEHTLRPMEISLWLQEEASQHTFGKPSPAEAP